MRSTALTWVEIDEAALEENARSLKNRVGQPCIFAPVIKANGYGHGMTIAARAFERGGADWLCVHELEEALELRESGIELPLYIVGYVDSNDAHLVVESRARVVAYSVEFLQALNAAGEAGQWAVPVHIKLETGNNRQGLSPEEAFELARFASSSDFLVLEGVSTHFADVEDTTDHHFAQHQLSIFEAFKVRCSAANIDIPMFHSANSAATLLWSHAHGEMVRAGIAAYGLWPSKETLITALQAQQQPLKLHRSLTWKARIAQVKEVAPGEFVGYGRTYRTTHQSRIAVLTVGYYDGYDRKLSNQAFVLIRGHRAPVRGRICMNMMMVDVTHVPSVEPGEEVVLLGRSGDEEITAEMMAEWAGTIHYEIVSRIHERIPRIPKGGVG